MRHVDACGDSAMEADSRSRFSYQGAVSDGSPTASVVNVKAKPITERLPIRVGAVFEAIVRRNNHEDTKKN